MHPRLRRQLGADGKPLGGQEFLDAVEAAYRHSDSEKAQLEQSLAALATLLHRTRQQSEAVAEKKAGLRRSQLRNARIVTQARRESAVACVQTDGDLVVRYANPAAAALCGVPAPEGKGIFSILQPSELEALTLSWRSRLGRGEPLLQTLRCTSADQRQLTCDWICLPRLNRQGKLGSVTVLWRDQSLAVAGEQPLLPTPPADERVSLAVASAGEALFDWDLVTDRISISAECRTLLGIDPTGPVRAEDWYARVHPEDIAAMRAAISSHLLGQTSKIDQDHRVRTREGDWRWVSLRGASIQDEKKRPVRLTGLIGDITRHRALIERMAHDARHDPLTGLANRTLFLDLLRHSFHRIRRHESYRFAVLFIDIDRFKLVNDALGHEGGDELLVQIARRLEATLRQGDTLARHGGDEFTMWVDDVHNEEDALRVAARVHETMRPPFIIGEDSVDSSASIGIAIGSSRSIRAEDVLRDADVAMYRAKAEGRARTAVFEAGAGSAPTMRQLEADLRSADLLGQLRVHYLPIVDVATGRVKGLEALARWQHPRLGLVSPERFLALAVETGLIVGIDHWMMQTASRQLQSWRSNLGDLGDLTMSVNLSDKMLGHRDLPGQIDTLLREAHLRPKDLILDITEAAMTEGGVPAGTLSSLHSRGIGLHADDFGIGTSWLRQLHTLEVDSIKIDRSFLAGKGTEDRRVLGHLVAIARELGKTVIAEGVETDQQFRFLKEVGCDSAQGYLFSNPVDAEQTLSLLARGMRGGLA